MLMLVILCEFVKGKREVIPLTVENGKENKNVAPLILDGCTDPSSGVFSERGQAVVWRWGGREHTQRCPWGPCRWSK